MCCDIEFYNRELCCRVLCPRAWLSSELAACQNVCNIVYIDNILELKSLSYKIVFDLKTKFSFLKINNITVFELKSIAKQHGI